MTAFAMILALALLVAVGWYYVALRDYTGALTKMKVLAKDKGIQAGKPKDGLAMMKELNDKIATDESSRLLSVAESKAPIFVFRLRIVLLISACLLLVLGFLQIR